MQLKLGGFLSLWDFQGSSVGWGDLPSRAKDEPLPLARPQAERGWETGCSGFGGTHSSVGCAAP